MDGGSNAPKGTKMDTGGPGGCPAPVRDRVVSPAPVHQKCLKRSGSVCGPGPPGVVPKLLLTQNFRSSPSVSASLGGSTYRRFFVGNPDSLSNRRNSGELGGVAEFLGILRVRTVAFLGQLALKCIE